MAITDAPKCQHRREDGSRCQSLARRRLRLCEFHHREHKRSAKKVAERARQRWFESVALDDPKSRQKALAKIVERLLHGEIDNHRAGQLLHKLQMASINFAGKCEAGGAAALDFGDQTQPRSVDQMSDRGEWQIEESER